MSIVTDYIAYWSESGLVPRLSTVQEFSLGMQLSSRSKVMAIVYKAKEFF